MLGLGRRWYLMGLSGQRHLLGLSCWVTNFYSLKNLIVVTLPITTPSLRQNDAPGQHSSATMHNDASSGQNTNINAIADWTPFFFFFA